jgi:Protein kinase domain
MKADDRRICKVCGAQVSADRELCPVCILRVAIAEEEAGDKSDSERGSISEPVGRRFENYELMLHRDGRPIELGRGVMGVTYKAFDVDLRCPVTLKVISEKYIGDQSARLRFLREARAAASVRDANVASVFHLGQSRGNYFYAMEFVEGETLERLIKRAGRLDVKLALEITTQVG